MRRALARAAHERRPVRSRSRTAACRLPRPLARATSRTRCCLQLPVGRPLGRGDARGARAASARPRCASTPSPAAGARAALAACRAAAVPTVAIQHGIVYPKYFSYRHDAGRGGLPAAGPHRRVRRGRAPAARRRWAATRPQPRDHGQPASFDDLLARRARVGPRRRRGASWACADGERLVVVASRFRAHPRHARRRSAARSPACVRAIEAAARSARAIVKPHPGGASERATRRCCARPARARVTIAWTRAGPDAPACAVGRSRHGRVAVRGRGAGARAGRCWSSTCPRTCADLVAAGVRPGRAGGAIRAGARGRSRRQDPSARRSTAARDALPRRAGAWASTAAPPRASSRCCARRRPARPMVASGAR